MSAYPAGSIQGPHGLVLIEDCPNVSAQAQILCTCGVVFQARLRVVRRGTKKSCGCHVARPERTEKWLRRCIHDVNVRVWNRSGRHPNYAAIGVVPEWDRALAEDCHAAQDRFVAWALTQDRWGEPNSCLSLIDPLGPYGPDNCRFVTIFEGQSGAAQAFRKQARATA